MSTKIVFKYPLQPGFGWQVLSIPAGAEILSVGTDWLPQACVWALVDPASPVYDRKIYVASTGTPLPPDAHGLPFRGTFRPTNGIIAHVFAI
jgi:hypothetical protein